MGRGFAAIFSGARLERIGKDRADPNLPSADGPDIVYHTIKLSNARITGVRQYTGGAEDPRLLEDIAFTFQKIEIENKAGKTMAFDTWMSAF